MTPTDPHSVLEEAQTESDPKSSSRHLFFISTPRNLEPLLEAELRSMGIAEVKATYLGVEARLSREEVYRVVYASRLASRVLRP